jgi:hypothetical protein
MRTVAGVLLVVASAALLSGCYSPRELAEEFRFARQKPLETDLVGKWVPTTQTLEDMRGNGGYSISTHELVLNADKTFFMNNMPDWWATDFGESKKGFQSAAGRWTLSPATGDSDWGIDLVVGTSGIGFLHVRNQKPPYLIHIGIGDPDNGHFMLFERIK